jgi:hypothetical protein
VNHDKTASLQTSLGNKNDKKAFGHQYCDEVGCMMREIAGRDGAAGWRGPAFGGVS